MRPRRQHFVGCSELQSRRDRANPSNDQVSLLQRFEGQPDARDAHDRLRPRHEDFGDIGLRPFVPRVSLAALPTVIYPNQAGSGVTTLAAGSCGDDCITPTGTIWNGKWFADVHSTSGLALIVLRDASLTSAVSLTVNYDAYSSSNLASFVVLQPSGGWKAPLTEIEYLCFADLSSWPQSQRDLAQLPPDCGP
jgi:hypothetical protein